MPELKRGHTSQWFVVWKDEATLESWMNKRYPTVGIYYWPQTYSFGQLCNAMDAFEFYGFHLYNTHSSGTVRSYTHNGS